MAIKAILTAIDQAPEALREHYTERDGKFVLSVDPVDGFALEDVNGLKSALGAERTKREQLERDVIKFKDLDPEKAREALAKLAEFEGIDPTKEADKIANTKFEAAKAQLLEKHQADLGALNERNGHLTKTVESLLIDAAATAALAEAKGSVELLLPHVKSQVRVKELDGKFTVEVIDAAGNGRIADGKGTPMDIKGLVAEMRKSKTFAAGFEGSGHEGSGSQQPGARSYSKGDMGGTAEERKAAIRAKFNLKD